mmetsp:Transcript_5178/g.15170  ORF Transcript_5178/g.15170 Transcript_5178/m.15170 type:complete len:204 (+) Transcript_5178:302-913(+)
MGVDADACRQRVVCLCVMPLLCRRRGGGGGPWLGRVEGGVLAHGAARRLARLEPLEDAALVEVVPARQVDDNLRGLQRLEADRAHVPLCVLLAQAAGRQAVEPLCVRAEGLLLLGADLVVELEQHLVVTLGEVALHERQPRQLRAAAAARTNTRGAQPAHRGVERRALVSVEPAGRRGETAQPWKETSEPGATAQPHPHPVAK